MSARNKKKKESPRHRTFDSDVARSPAKGDVMEMEPVRCRRTSDPGGGGVLGLSIACGRPAGAQKACILREARTVRWPPPSQSLRRGRFSKKCAQAHNEKPRGRKTTKRAKIVKPPPLFDGRLCVL